jgi:hypothetical protein
MHVGDILEARHVDVGSLHRAVDSVIGQIEEEGLFF